MKRVCLLISFCCLTLFVSIPFRGHAAEPWEADRLFWLNMNWPENPTYFTRTVNRFTADAKGEKVGVTLSPDTIAVQEITSSIKDIVPGGGGDKGWVWMWPPSMKYLPVGATNQAVAWPAAGNVEPTQGAISLFVQGDNWDVTTPQRETLFMLEGKAGVLAIEKNKPNTLAVTLDGRPLIETPLANPNRYHHLVVNFATDAKKKTARVALYVDRHLAGEAQAVTLPATYDRIVVGQLGPGPGTNKILDNIAVYRRPLLQGEITKIYYLEGRKALPKLVTVPFATKLPKIDGIFDPGEWDNSGELCGFVDASLDDGTVAFYGSDKPWDVEDTVRLAYDNQYLYFAYHCPPPAPIKGNAPMIAAMLKESKAGFDTDVDSDDSLEINIFRSYPYGDLYHLIVNGMNTHYEYSDAGPAPGGVEKGRALAWNPKWITGTTLTMDGWKLEGAIPWADLKMDAPKPGAELKINFARWWRTTLSGLASWAQGSRHGDADKNCFLPAGTLRFGAPAGVAVQLTQIGSLNQGNLDLRANLVNAGEQPAKVRVEMGSNSGEINKTQEMEIPAHGTAPFSFKGRVSNPETGEVVFRVTDAANALIYAAGYPLVRKDHPDIYLRKYPGWNLVKFEVDFTSLAQVAAKDLTGTMEVRSAGNKKVVATVKADKFADYSHTFELPTKGLPVGKYEARFAFSSKGKALDATTFAFDIKPLPEWYNNTIGFDDPERPAYPFTKLEVRNDKEVCIWGRGYHFNDSLLPNVEINPAHFPAMLPYPGGGRNLLRSPMRLAGKAGDTTFSTDQLKAEYKWTQKSGTRVTGTRKVTAGNLAINTDILMEYDGFCWVKVTLAPVKDKVELQSLALEELFTPEFSDVVNAGEYSLVGTGAMPKAPLIKSAVQPIWLGNGDGGLQTFVTTLAAFHVKDLQTTLQVIPDAAGATMRYNLVDQPMTITKPYVIEFGFNATPVRPKEWRTPREQMISHRWSYFTFFTTPDMQTGDTNWANTYWNGAMIVPDHTPDRGGYWQRNQPYMTLDLASINDPDVQEFGDEWLKDQDTRWRQNIGTASFLSVTHDAKSYRDWVMWRMSELFKRAPYVGVYYDVTDVITSSNPYTGAGREREDGTRIPTGSVLGLRDITKRMYNLCRRTYPDGMTMFHDSGTPHMGYMSFCEIFYDGENLNSAINAQRPTYRGLLTPSMYRAEYMGHNFGPQLWWLAQGRIAKDTVQKYGADVLEDHMAGMMLLHDCPVMFGGGFSQWHANEPLVRTQDAIRRYDLNSCGYKFLPYWKDSTVSGLKENQYASFYVHQPLPINHEYWQFYSRAETDTNLPHRAIGIFCNESDWKGEMVAKVDLKKLGFADGAKIKAINAVHSTGFRVDNAGTPQEKGVYFPKSEETATLAGDELRFPMSEWNYRMIVLEEEK